MQIATTQNYLNDLLREIKLMEKKMAAFNGNSNLIDWTWKPAGPGVTHSNPL